MDTFRIAVLIAATLATGLNAGLYYTYACSIMVTMRHLDDRTFVHVMQRLNRDITNGWFALAFVGSVLVTGLALILLIGGPGTVLLPVAISLGLCLLSLGLTMGVNVPMNNRLDKVGDPDTMTPQALADARRVFENPWVRHNLNRLFVSIASCGALCWALLAS